MKKIIFICIIVLIVIGTGLSIFISKAIDKYYINNIIFYMKNVEYVELSYGGNTKKLNNELAKMISKLSNNSITGYSYDSISSKNNAVQAYIFTFYSKNKELYRISFEEGNKEINIFRTDIATSKDYLINNEEILDYIIAEVEKF